MSSTTITLGIVGNPDSVSGIQPLVEIGNSPFNLRQDKLFIDQVLGDYYIELVHTHEYISYQYVSRPSTVHSFGAGRPGSFWMALTIPCKKRFANGVSPYDVLIEVRNVFRACFMTQKMDGSYEYKQGSYTSAPIDEVLKKYSLEDLPGRYIPMDGSSRAVVCPGSEKAMSEFFADTQYEQFARVSSVVVTESTSWSGVLPLEIPRPVRFEVRAGTETIGELVKADEKFRKVFLPKDDVHEPVEVSFSVSDLRNGATYSEAIVNLNETTQIIEVQPVYPEKRFKVQLLITSSRGELSSVSYIPERFFLMTRSGQRKNFRADETGRFVEFFGEEANLEWHVQYDVPQENCQFTYNVLSWDPKSLAGSIHVVLTPYAEFEGIEYSVSRHVHEQPVFLEVFLSNGDSYKFPLRGDGKRPFSTWRRSMIKDVRLVSDNYDYPALTQNYDPVSGWLKVSLDSEPAPRKKEIVKGAEESKGYLEIVNQTVFMEATVFMLFSDGSYFSNKAKLDRQSGDAPNVRIPIPSFTSGKLKEVELCNIRNLEGGNDNRYGNVIFKRGGERPVEGPSKEGNYKVTVKELPIQSKMAIFGGAFKKKIPVWALITGILLALVVGAGACYGIMEYLSQKNPSATERPASGHTAALQQGKTTQAKTEDTQVTEDNSQHVSDNPEQQQESQDNNPSASNTPAPFVPDKTDSDKISSYYTMMASLKDANGQPMTFEQAREINKWQKALRKNAGNATGWSDKFPFIEKYIPLFVEAADEIENIKQGAYRGKSLDEYQSAQKLYQISRQCSPGRIKQEDANALASFRKAIQNLAIMDDSEKTGDKALRLQRAVLTNKPKDVKILADVSSFLGIEEALKDK